MIAMGPKWVRMLTSKGHANRDRLTDIENKLMVTKGERGAGIN